MRPEIGKTKSLAGASDLTLLAPIKPGLVSSLESITYKTRLNRLLRTLTSIRASSHESALLRPFSDAVERVGRIHSVRVAVIEPGDKVLLAVTFDGAWESYIRVLWQKVGGLLDVIFCHTEGFVSACDSSFAEYLEWAKRVQIESSFFYALPHTVDDVQYLRREELLQRMTDEAMDKLHQTTDRELLATRMSVKSAEANAAEQRHEATIPEAVSQGMQALVGFYRLADLFLPGSADGHHLQRAAQELLVEFRGLLPLLPKKTSAALSARFDKQLDWLGERIENLRPEPKLMPPSYVTTDVQGGIVTGYAGVTHGCLMLMTFDEPAACARFLEKLAVTTDGTVPGDRAPVVNIAFSFQGLRALGLSGTQLGYFPEEFCLGMEARASILGDLRTNHPRRWHLPKLVADDLSKTTSAPAELSMVHFIVQLRVKDSMDNTCDDPLSADHPLHAKLMEIASYDKGVRLIAVEPMRRTIEYVEGKEKIREHFGFLDGEGQPLIGPQSGYRYYGNAIHLGEVLLGYSNEADPAPSPQLDDPVERDRHELFFNGSFLVLRKLRQDVEAFLKKAEKAAKASGFDHRDRVLEKLMGRKRDGTPLVTRVGEGNPNDFDFQGDPEGAQCPLHSHIRRANPRTPDDPQEPFGKRTPRIMRRGMSYGLRYDESSSSATNGAERGLMFMAYNASISEQFEVVQRWMSGGNSSGGLSYQSDPLLGVPEIGKQRFFRFEQDDKVVRVELDGSSTLLEDPRPFVRLEWGMYLFTPSMTALRKLKEIARQGRVARPSWSVAEGDRAIASLRAAELECDEQIAIEAWKSALEDPQAQEEFLSASIWAAIRERHGGALRTPYGVLVADRRLVMQVLRDPTGRYTASGYHQRMSRSIGEIYLGLDRPSEGGQYDKEALATNKAIASLGRKEVFELTYGITQQVLATFVQRTIDLARDNKQKQWVLMLDVKEASDQMLAMISRFWFGLPEKGALEAGASRWGWKRGDVPLYPGNFTAPSRYIFQPRPGAKVEEIGCLYGQTLTDAMHEFVKPFCMKGGTPVGPTGRPAPIAAAILEACRRGELTTLQVARTFVGALMGFLPTVDGNLRRSLNEWLNDQSFWCLRARMPSAGTTAYERAEKLLLQPLMRAMQLRPAPELIWRRATSHHDLGPVAVAPGDLIVVSIVSATQQCLQHGEANVYPIFGGNRSEPAHPTHACPGYEASMGMLLGFIAALLETKETLRPAPAPLVVAISGVVPDASS